jgi:hypothetical protein
MGSPESTAARGPVAAQDRQLDLEQYRTEKDAGQVSFSRDVQPILEGRCVVCHGCYDAPCQLKLESGVGIDRGAHKLPVYNSRLRPTAPTRLNIDAQTAAGWRTKGFHPVLNEQPGSTPQANIDNSVLAQMLLLKQAHALPAEGILGRDFEFGLTRRLQCPARDEFDRFAQRRPLWGMPYGLPGLKPGEHDTVLAWIKQGARYPEPPPLPPETLADVARYEALLNGSSLKERLAARYIYEHLFAGHLHFKGHPDREFFRLVRSRTPSGQPVDEIATVKPFDDPGPNRFYYRLRPIYESIVDKNHMVYELGPDREKRWKELFFEPDYPVTAWPGYDPETAANPFRVFAALPPESRYRFMLDDAYFFIVGFMKGPVCRGQVALNSIRDRFWVVFYDPDKDRISNDAAFLATQEDNLRLPSERRSEIGIRELMLRFSALHRQYLSAKNAYLRQEPDNVRNSLAAIWDGDGQNPGAALTAFRHFDSASLSDGLVGGPPQTAWAIDYPLFERLHYLLVAGFNVFGSVQHQAAARLYMSHLRNEAENNFLSFLPARTRPAVFRHWNRGRGAGLKAAWKNPYFGYGKDSAVAFATGEPKAELFDLVRERLGAMAGPPDLLNDCRQPPCDRPGASPLEIEAERRLRGLAHLQGGGIRYLPELSYIRVGDAVYSLARNKGLLNVSFMFRETSRRVPAEDTLTIVPGFIGSYPNYFFDVPPEQLAEFVQRIKRLSGEADAAALAESYGVRRTSGRFWEYSDFFNRRYRERNPVTAGIFDLNRYENR